MALELKIDGYFEMSIYKVKGNEEIEVSEAEEKEVLEKLNNGTYLFGIDSKTIISLDDFKNPLYVVSLDGTDALEYEFDEL